MGWVREMRVIVIKVDLELMKHYTPIENCISRVKDFFKEIEKIVRFPDINLIITPIVVKYDVISG